jgi:hypothetical protein
MIIYDILNRIIETIKNNLETIISNDECPNELKANLNTITVFDGVIAPPSHCTPPIFRILKHFILTCHCTPHFEIIRKLFKCIIVIYKIYCDFEKIILSK